MSCTYGVGKMHAEIERGEQTRDKSQNVKIPAMTLSLFEKKCNSHTTHQDPHIEEEGYAAYSKY